VLQFFFIYLFTLSCVTNLCLLSVGRVEKRWRSWYSNILRAGGPKIRRSLSSKYKRVLPLRVSRPAVGSTYLHVQCVLGALSLRVKREGR